MRDLFEWLGLETPGSVCGFRFQFYCFGKIYTRAQSGSEQKHPVPVQPETNKRFKKIPKNLKCRNVADKAVFKCKRQIFVQK